MAPAEFEQAYYHQQQAPAEVAGLKPQSPENPGRFNVLRELDYWTDSLELGKDRP